MWRGGCEQQGEEKPRKERRTKVVVRKKKRVCDALVEVAVNQVYALNDMGRGG